MTNTMSKPSRLLILTFGVLATGIALLGCRPAEKTSNTPITKPAKPKLLIQRQKNGTETGVYQQKFKIMQPVKVGGQVVSGNHKIELTNMATYPGGPAKCIPSSLVMNILHEKPEKGGWQFADSPKVSWVVDGQTTQPVKVLGAPIEFEDGGYWESLITQPTCETFEQLGNGTKAEIRINDAVIEFSQDDLDAFKEFASSIGLRR